MATAIATSMQTYEIAVGTTRVNKAPTITTTPTFLADTARAYQYQVLATDPDGGDTLTYELISAPSGMSIDSTTGLVTWKSPNAGTYKVVVGANDGNLGAAQGFTLTARANQLPEIASTNPPTGAMPDVLYVYDAIARDPDGGKLIYEIDDASKAKGITIDELGRLRWTPTKAQTGINNVSITIKDESGGTITQNFSINVQADVTAPQVKLTYAGTIPAAKGDAVTFQVQATDDVKVSDLQLLVNGNAVILDANGIATVVLNAVGNIQIIAKAIDIAGNVGQDTTVTIPVFDPTTPANAPEVSLDLSGFADNVISSFSDIKGLVDDPDNNLLSYEVDVAPIGSEDWSRLFTGTSEVMAGGVLGKFDPSVLADDSYRIRLTATDTSGLSSSVEDQVNVVSQGLKLGNFRLSFTDLSIPVSGIPINVTRTYDSLNAKNRDDFGYGWRLEFRDTDLRVNLPKDDNYELTGLRSAAFTEGTKVFITLPGGKRETFTFKATRDFLSGFLPAIEGYDTAIYHPAFTAEKGVTDTLTVVDTRLSNVNGKYYSLGSGVPYNPADNYFGNRYILTTKEGIVYEIDGTTGDLNSVTNPNGNKLTFTDAGITSDSGQSVSFGRDASGRITSVTDPSGQQVKYAYDAKGDLIGVTDRQENTTAFKYAQPDRNHFLTEIVDPLGRTGVKTEYDAQGRLVKMVDALGKPVELAYDPTNSSQTVKDALGNPTTYVYDTRGNVVSEVDALGGIVTRTYDDENNLLSQTDALGRTTSYTYDSLNNKTSETDALGNTTRYSYGAYGRMLSETDALGNVTTNGYDKRGNLLSRKDALGNVTGFDYDLRGQLTSTTDALGRTSSFNYDAFGRIISSADALGNETSFSYDTNGNQLSETTTVTTPTGIKEVKTLNTYDANGWLLSSTDAEGRVTRTEYDANGKAKYSFDALNHRTEYKYDEKGQLTETIYADGTSTKSVYDDAGRQIASINQAGVKTVFVYDALGRLVETIEPDDTPNDLSDNPRTKTEYDLAGQVLAQVDQRGNRTTFSYDLDGRQTAITDALNFKTIFAYDNAGRRVSVKDALNHTTSYQYDAVGRNTKTIFADGSFTTTDYDKLGRRVSTSDQAGVATGYEYDALNRLTAVIDGLNQRTSYGYDQLGRMVSQTDANGHTTSFEYDLTGQRVAKVLPLGQRFTYFYDAVGNLKSQTDANGQMATMTYDVMNRLTSESYQDGKIIAYSYNAVGQRKTVTDSRGVTVFNYDVRDRLASRIDPDGKSIAYTYDAASNRTSVTIPAGTTSYTFDALNRLDTVINGTDVTDYDYNAVGNLSQTILPNGIIESRSYDALNRLLKVESKKGADILAGFTYTLDKAGMRTSVTEQNGRKVDYSYDKLYRLTEEKITDAVNGNRTTAYSMDAVGNRLSKTDSVDGTTNYVYDANDRLLTETKGSEVTSYGYDNNGNTQSKTNGTDVTLYSWNDQGRLVGVQNPNSDTVSYQYNENGIRVSSTINGVKTSYLLDANRDYAQVLEEYDSSGTKVSYVHGIDLISQNRSGAKSFYLVDGLGSTRALTDASGVVTDRYIYDAYGNVLSSIGSTQNSYLYTGEQFDAGVGQYYLRDRYYNQAVGRFTRGDTFAGTAFKPISLHDYVYASVNPSNYIDPSGLYSDTLSLPAIQSFLISAYSNVNAIGNGVLLIARSKLFATGLTSVLPVATAATLAPLLQDEWEDLKKKIATVAASFAGSGIPLFHYTDLNGMIGILADQAIRATEKYTGNGFTHPTGAYATSIPPIPPVTRSELQDSYKLGDRSWDVSFFVMMLQNENTFRQSGYPFEWVADAPYAGFPVQVVVRLSGPNLMLP
jgi:RHS repeat-associated protein